MAKTVKTMDIDIGGVSFNCTAGGWLTLDSYFRELKHVKQPYRGFYKDIASACRDLLLEQVPQPESKLITKKQAERAISLLEKPEIVVKPKRSFNYRRWILPVTGLGYIAAAIFISHHTFLAPNPSPQVPYYGEPIYSTSTSRIIGIVPVLDQVVAALLVLGLVGFGIVNIASAFYGSWRKRLAWFNGGLGATIIVGLVLLVAVSHAIISMNPSPPPPSANLNHPFVGIDLCGEHIQLVQTGGGQESAVFYHLKNEGWHLVVALPPYVNNKNDPLKSSSFCESYYALRIHYPNNRIALNNFHYGAGNQVEPFVWDVNTIEQERFGLFVKD